MAAPMKGSDPPTEPTITLTISEGMRLRETYLLDWDVPSSKATGEGEEVDSRMVFPDGGYGTKDLPGN